MSEITEHVAMIENQAVQFENMTVMDYLTLKQAYFDNEIDLQETGFGKGFMTLAYQRNLDNYRLKKYNEKIL